MAAMLYPGDIMCGKSVAAMAAPTVTNPDPAFATLSPC